VTHVERAFRSVKILQALALALGLLRRGTSRSTQCRLKSQRLQSRTRRHRHHDVSKLRRILREPPAKFFEVKFYDVLVILVAVVRRVIVPITVPSFGSALRVP
jgi:hypothetical protein